MIWSPLSELPSVPVDSSSRFLTTYDSIVTLGLSGCEVKFVIPSAAWRSFSRGIRIGPAQIFCGYGNTRGITLNYHCNSNPPPPPRSAHSKSGSAEAQITEPSYFTTSHCSVDKIDNASGLEKTKQANICLRTPFIPSSVETSTIVAYLEFFIAERPSGKDYRGGKAVLSLATTQTVLSPFLRLSSCRDVGGTALPVSVHCRLDHVRDFDPFKPTLALAEEPFSRFVDTPESVPHMPKYTDFLQMRPNGRTCLENQTRPAEDRIANGSTPAIALIYACIALDALQDITRELSNVNPSLEESLHVEPWRPMFASQAASIIQLSTCGGDRPDETLAVAVGPSISDRYHSNILRRSEPHARPELLQAHVRSSNTGNVDHASAQTNADALGENDLAVFSRKVDRHQAEGL
ncbi:hypothetical protein BBP40_008472 [Aspergillus hancockii]|nr:hypothetical protein BBP40_008472 [Aspergillus hancockii]